MKGVCGILLIAIKWEILKIEIKNEFWKLHSLDYLHISKKLMGWTN